MNKPATVPNPATPRGLRPVHLITDRAKRYRANRNPPPGPRRCAFCASSRKNLDIDHIDGDESHGERDNLMYLCRSCNARKGRTQANAGAGTRTRQYNPEPARRVTFRQYVNAVLVLRGDQAGDVRRAAGVMRSTSPGAREKFTALIAQAKNPATPSYAQYGFAVSIHQKGRHDEGGAIIHATPPAKRHEYAQRMATARRRRKAAAA